MKKNEKLIKSNQVVPNYLNYPPSEDIYNNDKKEIEIDPEDITKTKESNKNDGNNNEKVFNQDKSGSDLDIPGSELDDEQEKNGNEDEENNGYSIGGDNHTNLDENNG
jgi:hypothetical protein